MDWIARLCKLRAVAIAWLAANGYPAVIARPTTRMILQPR